MMALNDGTLLLGEALVVVPRRAKSGPLYILNIVYGSPATKLNFFIG